MEHILDSTIHFHIYHIRMIFFIVIYPKSKIRVSDWPIPYCISKYVPMYLALFSFHLSPKLAITLSMLPEAGAISYFDWFRTLNRLELSAHDMYDAGFWGPQLGPVNCLCILQLSFFLHECSGGKALFFRLSKSRIFYVSEEIYKLIRNTNWNKLQIFFGRIPFCKSFLNPSINAKDSVWKKVCSRQSM